MSSLDPSIEVATAEVEPMAGTGSGQGGTGGRNVYTYPRRSAQTAAQANVPAGKDVVAILSGGGGAGGANNSGEDFGTGAGGGGGAVLIVTIPAAVWATVTAVDVGDDTGGGISTNGGDCKIVAGGTTLAIAHKGTNGAFASMGTGAGGVGGVTATDVTVTEVYHRDGLGAANVTAGNPGSAGGISFAPGSIAGAGGTAAAGGAGNLGGGGGGAGIDGTTAHAGGAGGRANCVISW